MKLGHDLSCKKCNSNNFLLRKESTFIYSYKVNVTEIGLDDEDYLPFIFDNREEKERREFLECQDCKTTYPVRIEEKNNKIRLTILQKAIRSDHTSKIEFLG